MHVYSIKLQLYSIFFSVPFFRLLLISYTYNFIRLWVQTVVYFCYSDVAVFTKR